jgi:hypothetical protein
MNPRLASPLVLLFLLRAVACDRTTSLPPASSQPSTTRATTTVPVASFTIDSQTVHFPPPHVRFTRKDVSIFAEIYSDEREAPAGDTAPKGGYYFDMELQPDEDQPELFTWTHKAPADERQELPQGIFLDADRTLQPVDVHATLSRFAGNVTIYLTGKFADFDRPDALKPSRIINVDATISTRIEP